MASRARVEHRICPSRGRSHSSPVQAERRGCTSACAGGDDAVPAAVHDQDRDGDVREVETPRRDEREVVVDQALGAGGARGPGVAAERGPACSTQPVGRSANDPTRTPSTSAWRSRASGALRRRAQRLGGGHPGRRSPSPS